MMDGPISLGSFTNRTLGVFLKPFEDALLVVNMLAFQPSNLLI